MPFTLKGFGVIGDSYTAPHRDINWTEQIARHHGVHFGPPTGDRYFYVREATTLTGTQAVKDLIPHVQSGNVTLIYLDGAGGDFTNVYAASYAGTYTAKQLADLRKDVIKALANGIDIFLKHSPAGNPVQFILETIGDIGDVPQFADPNSNVLGEKPVQKKRQPFIDAINEANKELRALAKQYSIPVFDQFTWAKEMFDAAKPPVVGDLTLDTSTAGAAASPAAAVTDPLRVFVDVLHAGPVPQGIKANAVLYAINKKHNLTIPCRSDKEILTHAYKLASKTLPATVPDGKCYPVKHFVIL